MDYLQKRIIALRYWLLAKDWHQALKAMEFAASHHVGTRKDGFTPEFSHQVFIAMYVRTLYKYLLYPEETFIAIFCHDLREDYDVSEEQLEKMFGESCLKSINLLTKKCESFKQPKHTEDYYFDISMDPIASVGKAADRMHNIQSMPMVFDMKKQHEYIEETEHFVLPMIKSAKRLFPEQEPIYENVKLCLINQIELIKTYFKVGEIV